MACTESIPRTHHVTFRTIPCYNLRSDNYPHQWAAVFSRTDFPGLEIRLHQRRGLKDGADMSLTRLEYGALCYLAGSPGREFTKAQIFEAVWSMESESCLSNDANENQ